MYSIDTALTIEFGFFSRLAVYGATLPGVAGQGQLLSGSLSENSHVLCQEGNQGQVCSVLSLSVQVGRSGLANTHYQGVTPSSAIRTHTG